jgi:hypothetical protein
LCLVYYNLSTFIFLKSLSFGGHYTSCPTSFSALLYFQNDRHILYKRNKNKNQQLQSFKNFIVRWFIGCLLGFLGSFYFPFYTLAGIFLGVSAAWLPMSNTSVNYYLKNTNQLIKGKTLISLLLFLALGFSFVFPPSLKYPLFFVFYGIVYLLSFQLVGNLDNYKVDPNDLEKASYKYLILFALFFVCLILLRSSRLLANSLEFDYFIFGFFFLVTLYIVAINFFKNKIQRNIPRKLSYLTAINGAVGNYLFLFCSLYVAGFYGHQHLFLQFYLPYVLGIVFASKVKNLLGNNVKTYSLIGIF